jgi:ubiquinone/menaquinone biosynthesis C-methylase UbiE
MTVHSLPPPMAVLQNKARARLFYKYLSKVYDKVNPFIWNEAMRAEAVGMLDLDADDRVLDVGCGTGFATEGLLEEVDVVHGLDQSEHQMAKAFGKFGKHGRVRFFRGDAERLPYKTDSFDVVWSSGSIEYWPNPVTALREFRRVLKPGGQVLVVGPNYPKTSVFQKLADAIMLFYDAEEADRMFDTAGFEDVEHRLMGPTYDPDVAIVSHGRAPD